MIGCPHGAHEGIGSPHGKVDGKHQPEHHQLRAGVLTDVGEVHLNELYHLRRQKVCQRLHHSRNIQIQQAQQGADKNEEREDREQQVKGQSGALDGHIVLIVTVRHQHAEAQKRIFRQGIAPHSSVSL